MNYSQAENSAINRQNRYAAYAELFLVEPDDAASVGQQEYYDCFFIPTSGKYVPAFESALLDYDTGRTSFGPLGGAAAVAVQACYDSIGFSSRTLQMFAPLQELNMPDYVGFELAFMALLCIAEQKSWLKNTANGAQEALQWRKLQTQFLGEHLTQWLPGLAAALAVKAPGYYAEAVCDITAWVQADVAELEIRPWKENQLDESGR